MKNQLQSQIYAMAAFAVAVLVSLSPSDAVARQRTSHGTGPRNGTLDREVTRTPGTVDKSTTYTSPKGKVSSREATKTKDPATGTISGSSTTTLANGKTATSSLNSEKTDTGRTTTAERTGFNGKTSTADSTTTKTDNGFTREAVRTGPNGGTVENDVAVTRKDGRVTRTATSTKTPPPTP